MWPNSFKPLTVTTASGQYVAAPLVIAASTAHAEGNLPGSNFTSDGNVDIRIENQTSGWAYITFGDGSQPNATSTNGIGFAPQSVEVIEVPYSANAVSVVLSTGSGSVRFTRGMGV